MKVTEFDAGSISYVTNRIECAPTNLNSRHCHDTYEILYVSEGSGRYVVEGVEYPVKPRTLMIFPPLTFHCVTIDEGAVYDRTVLYFEEGGVADCAKGAFSKLSDMASPAGAFYSADALPDAIISVFDRFEAIAQLPDLERESLSILLLSELLIHLSLAHHEDWHYDEGELGARVIRFLNNNMERDIPLDKLAKRFFVSKFYLCRAFKKYSGVSIHSYINHKRVMYAKQLIESGETASAAAYRVGFGDYSAFYRAYVKIVGRAPTATDERRENSDNEI